jgi:hypothetical protein
MATTIEIPQPLATATRTSIPGSKAGVQLTFSFEILSMQLTQHFKLDALQLQPTSNLVTMQLIEESREHSGGDQVVWELVEIKTNDRGFGALRLKPTSRHAAMLPGVNSFNVAGLQIVTGLSAAPLQLSPQGASVLATSGFDISSVEFSPSFEIAAIVVENRAKEISVRLPSVPEREATLSAFDIAYVGVDAGQLGVVELKSRGRPPGDLARVPQRLFGSDPLELQQFRTALESLLQPSAIQPWLNTPNQAFGGVRPSELIDRGEFAALWGMIHKLELGEPTL